MTNKKIQEKSKKIEILVICDSCRHIGYCYEYNNWKDYKNNENSKLNVYYNYPLDNKTKHKIDSIKQDFYKKHISSWIK